MTTTYFGESDQLAIAQAVLNEHVISSGDGLCIRCRVPGPCLRRETAAEVFAARRCLPRRVPGATRPELVSARRIGTAGLLTPAD